MGIIDALTRRIRGILQQRLGNLKALGAGKKKNIILVSSILMLGMGMFFSTFFDGLAFAQKGATAGQIDDEVIDPMNRIGKGMIKNVCVGDCQAKKAAQQKKQKEQQIAGFLANHPIVAMTEPIAQRDKKVAAYLIAIAKKESDWGKHAPKKSGRECWNFWGYRGGENPTASGYSCFDSPEHAVRVVGDRIERLLNNKIDTPAKMVVWKCGSDCEAAGGQAAANKWIADVAAYVRKAENI